MLAIFSFVTVGNSFFPRYEDYKTTSSYASACLKENNKFFVKEVCDGDTVILQDLQGVKSNIKLNKLCSHNTQLPKDMIKVRLLGIDSFEMRQAPYGKMAKEYLKKIASNKNVCFETDVEKKDKYGRTLAYLYTLNTEGNLFINEELIKSGYSIVYSFPPNTKHLETLKKAQVYARKSMTGIWEKGDYISETPAEFRKRKKS